MGAFRVGWLCAGLLPPVVACGQTKDDVGALGEVAGAAGSTAGGTGGTATAGGAGASASSGDNTVARAGVGGDPASVGGGEAGGGAGGEGAVEPRCEIQMLDSDCRVGAVAELSCSAPLRVSVTEQRGRTWLYVPDAPSDFSALHSVSCGKREEFALSERPPGSLLSSFDELPYVVNPTDTSLTLFRGLPDAIREESVAVAERMTAFIGPDSVVWYRAGVTGDEREHRIELNEAASLAEAPRSVVHEGPGGLSPRLMLYEGHPSAVVMLDGEWHALNVASTTPLGTIHGGLDWSFDGGASIGLSAERHTLADGSSIAGISVSGLEPEFAARRLADVYGFGADEAARRAQESPLTQQYLAAPVLALGNGWQSGSCTPDAATPCTFSSGVTQSSPLVLERAEARLGRDSAGVPWLVAVREVADSSCVTTPICAESQCRCSSSREAGASTLALVFRRLALPSTELEFPLPGANYSLWVDGAVGAVVLDSATRADRTVTVWRFDLDAL